MARLLIIDDEESLCQILENTFREKGHIVETATSGQAAKAKIESQVYDLIISDIRMPDLTGLELLEHARASKDPDTVHPDDCGSDHGDGHPGRESGGLPLCDQDRYFGGRSFRDGRRRAERAGLR